MSQEALAQTLSIDTLPEAIQLIGLREVINLVLVHENIRPAMLIQPIDYQENSHEDPQTDAILKAIQRFFPSLFISTDYGFYQGAIVSKTKFGVGTIFSDSDMGKTLGYPCASGFSSINRTAVFYQIDTLVSLNDGYSNCKTQLFANMCSCPQSHFQDFNFIVERINMSQNPMLKALVQEAYLEVSELKLRPRYAKKRPRSKRCRHYLSTILRTTSKLDSM
jgi:hypothetical protein